MNKNLNVNLLNLTKQKTLDAGIVSWESGNWYKRRSHFVDIEKIMGDEGNAAFYEVIKLATKYDQFEATLREDLSYLPKN